MRRNAALPLCLCALLALSACGGPSAARTAEQEREAASLRARVERLERDTAEDRARTAENLAALREDLTSLRAALEEASRHVAALSPPGPGQDPANIPGPAAASPRVALRESLHRMLETTRQALERLNLQMERSLGSHKPAEKPAPPAP